MAPKSAKNDPTLRLFVAVEVCPAIVERAQQLIARLVTAGAVVSWVKPQNMHVTLQFGEAVPRGKADKVLQVVAQAAAVQQPFELQFAGAGAFPRLQRPQILWLGIDDPSGGLAALHRTLEKSLARLGFPKESRGYHPHLTLGRLRNANASAMQALSNVLQPETAFDAGTQTAGELAVFSSELTTAGPVYTALARAKLGTLAGS